MAELLKPKANPQRVTLMVVALIVSVVLMSLLLVNRLPVELVVEGPAINAPPSTSQPGLFAIVLALHPRLAAAFESTIEAVERVKSQLRPEPAAPVETYVVYVADENGNFVPGRR